MFQIFDRFERCCFRILELSQRHRSETDGEVDRLRAEKHNLERTLDLREKLHKTRQKALEEQLNTMKGEVKFRLLIFKYKIIFYWF